jgi:hypothetical protein
VVACALIAGAFGWAGALVGCVIVGAWWPLAAVFVSPVALCGIWLAIGALWTAAMVNPLPRHLSRSAWTLSGVWAASVFVAAMLGSLPLLYVGLPLAVVLVAGWIIVAARRSADHWYLRGKAAGALRIAEAIAAEAAAATARALDARNQLAEVATPDPDTFAAMMRDAGAGTLEDL